MAYIYALNCIHIIIYTINFMCVYDGRYLHKRKVLGNNNIMAKNNTFAYFVGEAMRASILDGYTKSQKPFSVARVPCTIYIC